MELSPGGFLAVAVAMVALVGGLPLWYRHWRLTRPFPPAFDGILRARLPVYTALDDELRQRLQRLVLAFLYDKRFYGCQGLVVDDEIRVTIAGTACLLLLGRPGNVYPALRYILVYPAGFVASRIEYDRAGVASRHTVELLGEAWDSGKVILSWDDAIDGVRDFGDGRNVVLHEFAHQLDGESGSFNGAPPLPSGISYRDWTQVLGDEFERLRDDALAGHHGLLDHYGATDPAEFFAVATETYFEQPLRMVCEHPALFEQLHGYYRVDPRDWRRSDE